ncbi:MAG: DNA primase [Candidatus Omnitrophota bacterium]
MAIPQEIIDKIQGSVDIVDVISSYIALKKSGRNFKACCPFHGEKTPSFMVNREKQIFHCFGCGAGGNVFGFLMKHERMEFPEAVRYLADKAGISMPALSSGDQRNRALADQLYRINDEACAFYQSHLLNDKSAMAYLADRGIGREAIQTFKLGLAPDSWDALTGYFKRKNVDEKIIEGSGLAIARESGSRYDRFRNRVIFPIFDVRGRVLGFGGRVKDQSVPKYINSPETYIYSKGRHLYGFNLSKDFVRDKKYAVMVEGYFDLIVPFQAGVGNCIATLGTSLTSEQIKLLKRFCNTVVTIYDPDEAGESAALRSLDLFIAEGVNVYVATLEKGYDPDAFVRKFGLEEFNNVIRSAKNLFDYKLGLLSARFNPNDMNGKVAIAGEMLPTISRIENAVLQSGMMKKLSEYLAVDEEALRIELSKIRADYKNKPVVREKAAAVSEGALRSAEKMLLGLMLEGGRCVERVKESIRLDEIRDEHVRRIMQVILDMGTDANALGPSRIMNQFDPNDTATTIISEAIIVNEVVEDTERAVEDCIARIKTDHIKLELKKLQDEIRSAHRSKDDLRLQGLVAQYNDLIKNKYAKA